MKKVFFGLLVLSFVAVTSGGGSSGTPADANSSVAGATVSSVLAGAGNPYSGISEVGINESISIPVDATVDCSVIEGGISGTMTVSGTINVTASDSSATIDGTLTEVMSDCTVTDTVCDFGDVVGNGTLTVVISGSSDGSAVSFTETVKGDLSFVFKSKTLACPVDLALNVNADTTYTQEGITNAMTGTICGADWASVKAALADPTQMEALCTAFDAAATQI
jgi:hypothetical protein